MIVGTHVTLFSKDAVADRNFFKDILKVPNVDAGGGWLIFTFPRSTCGFEALSMYPEKKTDDEGKSHDTHCIPGLVKSMFLLAVDDVEEFRKKLKEEANIESEDPVKVDWGIILTFTLPGGAKLQAYQPFHDVSDHETSANEQAAATDNPKKHKAVEIGQESQKRAKTI